MTMKIKYLLLAKILRRILQLALVIIIVRALVGAFFFIVPLNKDTVIQNYYPVKLNAKIFIPDSVQTYQSDRGTIAYFAYTNNTISSKDVYKADSQYKTKDLIRNKLKVIQNGKNSITTLSNHISAKEVTLMLHSENAVYNFLWSMNHQLEYLIYISFLVILIILLGAYIKGEFIHHRSFRLISLFGMFLIFKEVIGLFCSYINSQIISSIRLFSTINGSYYKDIDISFFSIDFINFSNIFIGIMVILLSEIIRNAVIFKQENDLTI
jgi:hypothetical protein